MLIYSDDDTASSMFTTSAIPTIAAVYGLGSTINATDRAGHWGAARITAADMTTFLYRAANDPWVGPWLIPVMSQTAANGSDGFDQYFGMNRLTGEHGSKQGWGCDSSWTSPQCAIHSVGYTDRYFVAILQLGGYPDPMRWTSTTSAGLIQQSTVSLRDGDFVCEASTGRVFRLAGGAPLHVSSWTPFGGQQPCRSLSDAEFARLPQYPANGTFIEDAVSGAVYRIAGGAPVYVSTWSAFGGGQPRIAVDRPPSSEPEPARRTTICAITRPTTPFSGAPVPARSTASPAGRRSTCRLVRLRRCPAHRRRDDAAIDRAGSGPFYGHLRYYPADGTFVRGKKGGTVYRIAGGAPVVVTDWSAFGGSRPPSISIRSPWTWPAAADITTICGTARSMALRPGHQHRGGLSHRRRGARLRLQLVRGGRTADDHRHRFRGRGPGGQRGGLRPPALLPRRRHLSRDEQRKHLSDRRRRTVVRRRLDGPRRRPPSTDVDPAASAARVPAGTTRHLNYYPADGTFLEGLPGGRVYRVASRVPTYVPSWDPWGGCAAVHQDHPADHRPGWEWRRLNHLAPPAESDLTTDARGSSVNRAQGPAG